MKKKPSKPRVYVVLTATWGNDDAYSSIRISRRRWSALQAGAEYVQSSSSWYEGGRESVVWVFEKGKVTVDGEDGMVCVEDLPVSKLDVETIQTGDGR
jgi:hypothetical protein